MKKKIFVLGMVVLMAYFVGSVAIVGANDQNDDNDHHNGKNDQSGELNLYQKCTGSETEGFCARSIFDYFDSTLCPLTDDVTPRDSRAGSGRGKLKYNKRGPTFDFEFKGNGLKPGIYTLIYLPNVDTNSNCPGLYFTYFGSGVAKGDGKVHIEGSLDTGNLPGSYDVGPGAKIWLVRSEDISLPLPSFVGWQPAMYLFEEKLITLYTSD